MSKQYLVESAPEAAELALCEFDETYISLDAVAAHVAEGHIVTLLRSEVA